MKKKENKVDIDALRRLNRKERRSIAKKYKLPMLLGSNKPIIKEK